MRFLDYIINNGCFIVCSLLSTDWFIKYCDERGIKTSRKQLEQLEQLGLFRPMARVRHHQTSFWFRDDDAKILLEEGLLWDPSLHPFQPWETFRDQNEKERIENFYSVFQFYHLYKLLNATRLTQLRAERFVLYTKEQIDQILERISATTKEVIEQNQADNRTGPGLAAVICQIISNRYFPLTQSDRRTIQISSGNTINPWDWYEYSRGWNPKSVFGELSIDINVLKRLCETVKVDASRIDPLDMWSELVAFVALEKKEQLKGDARLGLTLRYMGDMLSTFHRDLTGDEVHLFDESPTDLDLRYGGEGVTQDNLEYLEYLANEYHLNPRPKLILVVEGDGERDQFPRVADEIFGLPFSHVEIEVRNLEGIGGFTGDKRRDKYGALEKFIDFNHHRQSIVFVVLDNEGRAATVKNSLVKKQSEHFPKRKVTRDEYVVVWNACIEFENFTDDEIALALTELCNREYPFTATEIATCRASGKGNPLKDFFNSKTEGKYELKKRELLKKLFDGILSLSGPEFEAKKMEERPVLKLIRRLLNLAAMNYQAQSREAWEANQQSGLYGHTSGEEEKGT